MPRWTVSMWGKRERERDSKGCVSNFLIKCSQPLFCGPLWSRYKLNVLFWWTFGGKLLPFITSSPTTISQARGGEVGGLRQRLLIAHAIQWVKNTFAFSPDRKYSTCKEKWGVRVCVALSSLVRCRIDGSLVQSVTRYQKRKLLHKIYRGW